jgi:hypothetical protein
VFCGQIPSSFGQRPLNWDRHGNRFLIKYRFLSDMKVSFLSNMKEGKSSLLDTFSTVCITVSILAIDFVK